jgi:hypothetical protein
MHGKYLIFEKFTLIKIYSALDIKFRENALELNIEGHDPMMQYRTYVIMD